MQTQICLGGSWRGGEDTDGSVCLENKDWTAGNHLGSQVVYVFLCASGWSVTPRWQLTSWYQARAMGEFALPRSLCNFGGISRSTRILQWVSCGWWDHESSGVPAPRSLAMVTAALLLSVRAKERLSSFFQSQRHCFSDHLATVISVFKHKHYNWELYPQPLFWDGLNVYFFKYCQGLGLGWGW